MSESAAQPKPPTILLVWLIISQLKALGSLCIWLVMAILSLIAFNAGITVEIVIFVAAIWTYPIFPLGMAIGSWIGYARRKNWLAAILSGLSFMPPFLFLLWWNM